MNREQKRALWKAARGDPDALYCKECKHKTIHVAESIGDVDHYDVFCEVCRRRIGRARIGEEGVTGDGPIKGRYWTKGDITDRARQFVEAYIIGGNADEIHNKDEGSGGIVDAAENAGNMQ